jgi:hypothetical protein
VVLERRHRTTGRIVGEAWTEEQVRLTPIPPRILAGFVGGDRAVSYPTSVIDLAVRRAGEQVQLRDLAEYEALSAVATS